MEQNGLKNKKIGIVVGQIIFILIMIFDVYLFFTKADLTPKLLSAGSFILLLVLLIISFKKSLQLKK